MQDVEVVQSFDTTLEYIEKPMKMIAIISSTIVIDRRNKKYKGTPGPRKENWVGSILQEVSTSSLPIFLWSTPLKMRLAKRCF
jgi:hypothetical protein